jgi:hypothetical protein
LSNKHSCLTQAGPISLLRSPSLYPRAFSKAWAKLTGCPHCWRAIDELRKKVPSLPGRHRGPFTSLFATLITQEPRHANHRRALAQARTKPHGLHWLLLEETAAFLPTTHGREGHRALELLHKLLEYLPSSPHREDLEARYAILSASLWLRYGFSAQAREALKQAQRHRRAGTGDRELRATLQVMEADLSAPDVWSDPWKKFVLRFLLRAKDLPELQVELLLQYAARFFRHDAWREAWRVLIHAEAIAEVAAPHLLPKVQTRLFTVESTLSRNVVKRYIGHEERLLFHCMAHYHERRLHPDQIQPLFPLPPWPENAGEDFSSLCLALAGGYEVSTVRWEEAGSRLLADSRGLLFLGRIDRMLQEEFREIYFSKGLSEGLLAPMARRMERLKKHPDWFEFPDRLGAITIPDRLGAQRGALAGPSTEEATSPLPRIPSNGQGSASFSSGFPEDPS